MDLNWIELFNDILKDDKNYNLEFFSGISAFKLAKIRKVLNVDLSGELLELLRQTDGILNKRFNDFIVFNSKKIIDYYLHHLEYLSEVESDVLYNYLFFADNGCGEHFGIEINDGMIKTSEISVYYPIENEYRIVAPNLYTWVVEWFSGKLAT